MLIDEYTSGSKNTPDLIDKFLYEHKRNLLFVTKDGKKSFYCSGLPPFVMKTNNIKREVYVTVSSTEHENDQLSHFLLSKVRDKGVNNTKAV